MASNINTIDIDTAYPIAGQDNDSQGFRSNFEVINDNFVEAKAEITALQEFSVAPTYTLGTLPALVAGGMIFVSDATNSTALTGSQCYCNGTVWIDMTTGAAVV